VHALFQPASNLAFGFDFRLQPSWGPKVSHNLPIVTVGVRLWKRESETVRWQSCTPPKTQSTPYRKVINDAGVHLLES